MSHYTKWCRKWIINERIRIKRKIWISLQIDEMKVWELNIKDKRDLYLS